MITKTIYNNQYTYYINHNIFCLLCQYSICILKIIINYYNMFNFFFPMFNTNLLCDVNDVLMIKYLFVLVKRGIMIIFNNYYTLQL